MSMSLLTIRSDPLPKKSRRDHESMTSQTKFQNSQPEIYLKDIYL